MEFDLDQLASEHSFSGVIGIEHDGEFRTHSYGLADRGHGIACTADHRFGIASGTKTLTALSVLAVAADGLIDLDGPIRELLGDELSLVDDRVTVRHLLHHRSGIGDYFDENADPDMLDHAIRVLPDARYGMGMWLDQRPGDASIEGMDAGVSFRSTRFADGSSYIVMSNTSDRAWPMARHLAEIVGGGT